MPVDSPLIIAESGYQLKDTELFLDPQEPVRTAIISHAHGDHAIPGHGTVYCTPHTAALMKARFRYVSDRIITPAYHETFEVQGIPFQFTPAGHMLGSAQVSWKIGEKTVLYTGDFKRQADSSCEAFEVKACDTLITECTFAGNRQSHPHALTSVQSLSRFGDINLVLGAYSMGKAQRLNRLLNEAFPDKEIYIHNKIVPYHKCYESAGFAPGKWTAYNRRQFKQGKNCIYIVPPGVLQSYLPSPLYLRGMSSGWDHLGVGLDFLLPVSDHAGWDELIQTVHDCGAKEVFTVHGDGAPLIEELTSKGIRISSLKQHD